MYNMDDLKFSVSMCVYGKDDPDHFNTAVDSILNQTRKPDEVVLVVDGPVPEKLDDVIKKFENPNFFKVIRLEKNQGHGNARRIGLDACSNELVALMDADDISLPFRFEKQIQMFCENPELAVVGGNITEFIDTQDNIVAARIVPQNDREIKKYLKKRCPFNQVTVMCRKSQITEAGGYIDWYCNEDYYLWLRLFLNNAKFANVQDFLVNVRVGKEMYKRRGGWKYFKSEVKLQKFMFDKKIISCFDFIFNVSVRLIVQVLMPIGLRGWFFKKLAREKA